MQKQTNTLYYDTFGEQYQSVVPILGKRSILKLPREMSIYHFRWVGGWFLKNYFDVFTVANVQ